MEIIEIARELGKAIQADQRYINLMEITNTADNDMELQAKIGKFNLKRLNINNEASKEPKNEEKIAELNKELMEIYGEIMANEHMVAYNQAKTELDSLVQKVTSIISMSAEGADPETIDLESSCTGSCSTCGGCH